MDKTIKQLKGQNFTYKRNQDYYNVLVPERRKELSKEGKAKKSCGMWLDGTFGH
jgi:Spy/CpxP family protein refolding chaperone